MTEPKPERIRIRLSETLDSFLVLSWIAIGLWVAVITFLLPMMIVGYFTESEIAIAATFFAVLIWAILFKSRGIELSSEGIHLRRLLGKPKLIIWQDVQSINDANREQVFRCSFTPLFRKHIIFTLGRGTLQIVTKDVFIYLRSKDLIEFLTNVRELSGKPDIRITAKIPEPPAPSTGTLVFGLRPIEYLIAIPTVLSLIVAFIVILNLPKLFMHSILLASTSDLPSVNDRGLQIPRLGISTSENSYGAINGLNIKLIGDIKSTDQNSADQTKNISITSGIAQR